MAMPRDPSPRARIHADKHRRMQNCIQRFRSRRRLNSTLNFYFNEFLFLGGVDTTPSPFSGQDPRALKDQDLTPAEIRDATATDTIHTNTLSAGDKFYGGNREHWSIDFTGVVSGFLSLPLCTITGLEKESLNLCVLLVENFLRYILMHDVCPEYEIDVYSAIDVCGKAREEWPMIQKLEAAFPGPFNLACANHWHTLSDGDWVPVGDFQSPAHAEAALAASLASLDPREHIHEAYLRGGGVPVREFDCALKVEEVHKVSDQIASNYKRLKFGENGDIVPVGTVRLSRTIIDDGWQHHETNTTVPERLSLHLENSILKHMTPGLKMEFTLVEVGEGAYYVKTLRQALPSFYEFLPQQLMRGWKPLRKHDRPAPSVHDRADDQPQAQGAETDGA